MINVEATMSSSLRGEVYGDHELLHSGGRAAFSLIVSTVVSLSFSRVGLLHNRLHRPHRLPPHHTCTMCGHMSSSRWSTTLGRGRMVTNRDRSEYLD